MEETKNEQPREAAPAPKKESAKKDGGSKGLICGMIVLAILALAGIGFGVWGMIAKDQAERNVADCGSNKTEDKEETDDVSGDNGTSSNGPVDCKTETADDNTTSDNVNPEDYLYIGEWGLKIKIPEEIMYLEYEYDEVSDTQQLCLMGARAEDKNYTGIGGILDINSEAAPMGCVVRGLSSHYPVDGSYPSLGEIFAIGDYTFRIYGPQTDPDTDDYSKNVYRENMILVKNMIANPENYSAI